jgi:hypothetical protein
MKNNLLIERDFSECLECDVSGNEVLYALRPSTCPPVVLLDVNVFPNGLDYGYHGPAGTFYNPRSSDLTLNQAFPFGGLAIWKNLGPAGTPTGRALLTSISYSDILAAKSESAGIIDISSMVHALAGPASLFFTAIATYDSPIEIALTTALSGGPLQITALAFANAPSATAPIVYSWVDLMGPGFTFIRHENDLGGVLINTASAVNGTLTLACNIPPFS